MKDVDSAFSDICSIYYLANWFFFSLGEYFPQVLNDTITVWEDESTSFDALENDYFAGGNASIIEFSKVHWVIVELYLMLIG